MIPNIRYADDTAVIASSFDELPVRQNDTLKK